MRRLLVLPIVHSRSDLGSLQTVASQAKVAALGERRAQAAAQAIDEFWSSLRECLLALQLDYSKVLIYQDGLPKVQNVTLQIEKQIVEELAKNGSPNHQLVKWMMDQGAILIGTESPDLLLQEYHAIRRSLTQGYRAETNTNVTKPGSDDPLSKGDTTTEPTLMQQRDRFIAARIDETLGNEQLGLLFIGMLHQVDRFLPDDIQVEFPVGRPPSAPAHIIDRNWSTDATTTTPNI